MTHCRHVIFSNRIFSFTGSNRNSACLTVEPYVSKIVSHALDVKSFWWPAHKNILPSALRSKCNCRLRYLRTVSHTLLNYNWRALFSVATRKRYTSHNPIKIKITMWLLHVLRLWEEICILLRTGFTNECLVQ